MRILRLCSVALVLVLAARGTTRADALPACEDGQHFEANPVPEGAMHHAGGRCVDDPGRGGCAASGRGSAAPWAVALGIAALSARRRSRARA